MTLIADSVSKAFEAGLKAAIDHAVIEYFKGLEAFIEATTQRTVDERFAVVTAQNRDIDEVIQRVLGSSEFENTVWAIAEVVSERKDLGLSEDDVLTLVRGVIRDELVVTVEVK